MAALPGRPLYYCHPFSCFLERKLTGLRCKSWMINVVDAWETTPFSIAIGIAIASRDRESSLMRPSCEENPPARERRFDTDPDSEWRLGDAPGLRRSCPVCIHFICGSICRPDQFDNDYQHNKEALSRLAEFQSQDLRNKVAGYIVRHRKVLERRE